MVPQHMQDGTMSTSSSQIKSTMAQQSQKLPSIQSGTVYDHIQEQPDQEAMDQQLDYVDDEQTEDAMRMISAQIAECENGGTLILMQTSQQDSMQQQLIEQQQEQQQSVVFGSQLVDKNSITPYSDATQVSLYLVHLFLRMQVF